MGFPQVAAPQHHVTVPLSNPLHPADRRWPARGGGKSKKTRRRGQKPAKYMQNAPLPPPSYDRQQPDSSQTALNSSRMPGKGAKGTNSEYKCRGETCREYRQLLTEHEYISAGNTTDEGVGNTHIAELTRDELACMCVCMYKVGTAVSSNTNPLPP